MKIAFVSVRPPYPQNSGGRIRTYQLLKQITQVHRVTLVTGVESPEEAEAARALQREIPALNLEVTTVAPRTKLSRRAWRVLRSPIDALPYTWSGYRDRRFTENLSRALKKQSFDLVHCDQTQIAHAVLALHTPPRLLNAHNVDSLLIRRLATIERRPWMRAAIRWQARKVHDAERRAYPRFDGSVATSEVDRAFIERLPGTGPVWTIPNGVDTDAFAPSEIPTEPGLMAFSGAMDWLPNVDAVRFFVQEILPRIRVQLPRTRLLVVGRDPAPELVEELTGMGVEFTGTVEDVRPFISRADLFVVPLRVGSGTRLKILEAWSMGKAVLSTPLGAEGLPALDGRNIAIADTAGGFAERAVTLLASPTSARRLGAEGRRTVEGAFSWKQVGGRLLTVYETVVASSSSGRR